MAAIAGKIIMAGGGPDEMIKTAVTAAQAADSIYDAVTDIANKAKAAAETAQNEFNIRKSFVDNSIAAINQKMLGQYCIIMCTDQEHDDTGNGGWLEGRILPMPLYQVEIAPGKMATYQAYVFEKGKYLRRGKWEGDAFGYYPPNSKMWTDIDMHVDFEAQPKVDPSEVEQEQPEGDAEGEPAGDEDQEGGADGEEEGATGDPEEEDQEPDAPEETGGEGPAEEEPENDQPEEEQAEEPVEEEPAEEEPEAPEEPEEAQEEPEQPEEQEQPEEPEAPEEAPEEPEQPEEQSAEHEDPAEE